MYEASLEKLHRRCREGDEAAQEELYLMLFRYLSRRLRAFPLSSVEIEDVATQKAVAVVFHPEPMERPGAVKKFAWTAARNQAIDILRRRSMRPEEPLESGADSDGPIREIPDWHDPAPEAARATSIDICRAVDSLQPPQNHIVRMRMEGLTLEEIGEILGFATSKVHSELQRALASIKEKLQ